VGVRKRSLEEKTLSGRGTLSEMKEEKEKDKIVKQSELG